jgi:hypothetical protein
VGVKGVRDNQVRDLSVLSVSVTYSYTTQAKAGRRGSVWPIRRQDARSWSFGSHPLYCPLILPFSFGSAVTWSDPEWACGLREGVASVLVEGERSSGYRWSVAWNISSDEAATLREDPISSHGSDAVHDRLHSQFFTIPIIVHHHHSSPH